MIDVKDIKSLYKLFDGSNVGEIEIQSGEKKLRLCFSEQQVSKAISVPKPQQQTENIKEKKEIPQKELCSKWVGFFTRLNPKTRENYIKLRDEVKKGQILGHVRVLGVLQDVVSEFDGKVKEILVEEGQPIEYGQPIMRFE